MDASSITNKANAVSSDDYVILEHINVQPVKRSVIKKIRSAEDRVREAGHDATLWHKRWIEAQRENFALVLKHFHLKSQKTQLNETVLSQQKLILELQQKVQEHDELKNLRSIEAEREKFELVKKNQDLENQNTQMNQALLHQQNIILGLQQKVQVHDKLKNAAKVYMNDFLKARRVSEECHEKYDPMSRPPKNLACNHVCNFSTQREELDEQVSMLNKKLKDDSDILLRCNLDFINRAREPELKETGRRRKAIPRKILNKEQDGDGEKNGFGEMKKVRLEEDDVIVEDQ